jgi:hypothetical protein
MKITKKTKLNDIVEKNPKVKFLINREIDEKMVYSMLKSNDPAGNWNRAQTMGLNKEQFGNIKSKKTYEEAREIISNIAESRYNGLSDLLKEKQKESQREWNKINDFFFKKIEEITKHKWKFSKYEVIISVFHPGLAPRGQNFIVRGFNQLPQKRITAHELLMAHLWEILEEKYPETDEEKLWAINEIATVAILGIEPELNDLWENKDYDSFLTNYPQLDKLKMKLKEIYLNKKDFEDYLNKSMQLIKSEEISPL